MSKRRAPSRRSIRAWRKYMAEAKAGRIRPNERRRHAR